MMPNLPFKVKVQQRIFTMLKAKNNFPNLSSVCQKTCQEEEDMVHVWFICLEMKAQTH